jgi:hypothetical protein
LKFRKNWGQKMNDSSNTPAPEVVNVATGRVLNESAIREHALRCSAQFRANKFTRVGEDFIDEVRADVECLLRELRNKYPTQLHPALPPDVMLITGALTEKVMEPLNEAIARLIQNKVQRQPTVGKTLGRTR